MHTKYHEHIAMLASKAVLYEVTASPKPGLVDRYNNGAHTDMDFFTFMASSSALNRGFLEIAQVAKEFVGQPFELLNRLRPIGIMMEEAMFEATSGVNTHKGIIFSLGLLVAATVEVSKRETPSAEVVATYVKTMTVGLTEELKNDDKDAQMTNGEKIFQTYGYTGIRGEVEAGFPTVMNFGLDALKKSYYTLGCKNKSFIQTLFRLMTVCEDSNIISRHNPETLNEVQEVAKNFLESGGMYQENCIQQVEELDKRFTEAYISPGGSADLLAVSIFFGLIENIIQ